MYNDYQNNLGQAGVSQAATPPKPAGAYDELRKLMKRLREYEDKSGWHANADDGTLKEMEAEAVQGVTALQKLADYKTVKDQANDILNAYGVVGIDDNGGFPMSESKEERFKKQMRRLYDFQDRYGKRPGLKNYFLDDADWFDRLKNSGRSVRILD